jgi:hypothetical protein
MDRINRELERAQRLSLFISGPYPGVLLGPKNASIDKHPKQAAVYETKDEKVQYTKEMGHRQQNHDKKLEDFMAQETDGGMADKAKEAWDNKTLDELK